MRVGEDLKLPRRGRKISQSHGRSAPVKEWAANFRPLPSRVRMASSAFEIWSSASIQKTPKNIRDHYALAEICKFAQLGIQFPTRFDNAHEAPPAAHRRDGAATGSLLKTGQPSTCLTTIPGSTPSDSVPGNFGFHVAIEPAVLCGAGKEEALTVADRIS